LLFFSSICSRPSECRKYRGQRSELVTNLQTQQQQFQQHQSKYNLQAVSTLEPLASNGSHVIKNGNEHGENRTNGVEPHNGHHFLPTETTNGHQLKGQPFLPPDSHSSSYHRKSSQVQLAASSQYFPHDFRSVTSAGVILPAVQNLPLQSAPVPSSTVRDLSVDR
jgi:hypothetical protein